MPYLAAKDINVDGEIRHNGEPVPEADSWPNPGPWERQGHIVRVSAADFQAAMEQWKPKAVSASPRREPVPRKATARKTAAKKSSSGKRSA